jgi:small subunit ribosomal protein S4
VSEYGLQLREKQKVRRLYGVLEKQFRLYFEKADRQRGETGKNLLILLERRLDNVVYRLGFASTRAESRQLVRHGHFRVNGARVNIPSFLVKPGDIVELREKSRKIQRVIDSLETSSRRQMPSWLELEKDVFKGSMKALPVREELSMQMDEQLIVELYSR